MHEWEKYPNKRHILFVVVLVVIVVVEQKIKYVFWGHSESNLEI